jgi:hypothetical protein
MAMHELIRLKEEFTEKGIMICFNGPFSHSIIEEIGNAVRRHLEGEEVKKDAIMDVFAVYIEQTQNVKNYIARKSFPVKGFNSAIIIIARKEGKYAISSGNVVEKIDTAALVERLDRIKGLDKEELKRLYKEEIRRKVPPGGTGAGVGLIEIARRASEKLTYVIDEIDETYNFFSLTAVI